MVTSPTGDYLSAAKDAVELRKGIATVQPALPKDPNEAALTLERMAFDLLYIRRWLMDRNLYGQLPSCRGTLADAAQSMQEFAEIHRLRAAAPKEETS